MRIFEKFKKFFNRSFENRMSFFNALAFFIFPVLALAILYIIFILIY